VTRAVPQRRSKGNGKAAPALCVRVAAYARISVAAREATQFSSIEAQVEAITAYVKSQESAGWSLVGEPYIDDGFSGATISRPGLTRLLGDVEDGLLDVVVVHRFDRFSRSQRDFLNLLHLLEENGTNFVSVTQALDTGTPMGHCMMIVITAFGQMERATIAERTRYKSGAARRRGIWTGGRPVLGYDVVDKRLVINKQEADRVRGIFKLYLYLGSLLAVVEELRVRGWTTKTWANKRGETVRGRAFNKSSVRALITNPIYIGMVRADGALCEGVHEAIVDEKTWQTVAAKLAENAAGMGGNGRKRRRTRGKALLSGIAYCAVCGSAMTRHNTKKGSRRYSYYVCVKHQKEGAAACPGSRVAAGQLESFIVDRIRRIGQDRALLEAAIAADRETRATRRPEIEERVRKLVAQLERLAAEREELVAALSQANGTTPALARKIAALDEEAESAKSRIHAAHSEIAALDAGGIDPEELRTALEDLEPIWEVLFPEERARLLDLLLERIEFNGPAGEVAITFRPGGPQAVQAEAGSDEQGGDHDRETGDTAKKPDNEEDI